MNIDYEIIPEIILYFLAFFGVYYALYRRFIFSLLDPLFIFIFTTAFASVLVVEILDESDNIIHFYLCQAFLFLGFYLVQGKNYKNNELKKEEMKEFVHEKPLKLTVYILLVIYSIGNIMIFFTKGFALLSDTPSYSKVGNFQEGFGIFRKINWATGGFITIGLLYFYLKYKNNKYIYLLFVVIFFTALEGSKGSLVKIFTSFAFLVYHPYFVNRKEIINSFKKYIPVSLISILAITFVVLYKENNDTEQVLFAFLRRLLYSGDSILYYYTPINENYFSRYTASDYPSYILNTIFGFLRVAPYKEAFGNIMVENALPAFAQADVIVGPNTPFYLEGKIFFGYYGAFIHSFIIGGIYSIIRKLFFTLKSGTAFNFVFICSVCLLASNILVDTSLFITILFDTCFWIIPVYVLSCFIVNKKIMITQPLFSLFNKKALEYDRH